MYLQRLLASAAILALLGCEKSTSIDIPEPVIPDKPVPELFVESSAIRLGLDVPIASIQQQLEARIPRSFNGRINDPTDLLTDDYIQWGVQRGAVSLAAGGPDVLIFTIPFSQGSVSLKGIVGVKRRNKGPLGWIEKTLSEPFSETANFAGTVSGSLRPTLQTDWSIDPHLDLSVNLTKAQADLFGKAIRISFRGKVEEAIAPKIREQVIALNNEVRSNPRIREAFADAWNQLHQVVAASTDPPVWLTVKPTSLHISNPVIDDKLVHMRLDAELDTRLYLMKDKPAAADVTELPSLTATPPTETGFRIAVPVAMKLGDFKEIAAKADLPKFDDGNMSVTFEDITVGGDNGRLIIGADVFAKHKSVSHAVKAKLYVVGDPRLDTASMTLSVQNADFSVGTKNVLVKAAEWLLKPVILAEINKRAVFAYSEKREQLVKQANDKLAELKDGLPKGVSTDLKVDTLDITHLVIDDGWLTAVITASGPAQVVVDLGSDLIPSQK